MFKDDVGVSWVTVIHIPYVPHSGFSWKPGSRKISLSWQHVFGTPDMTGKKIDGLDVLSLDGSR